MQSKLDQVKLFCNVKFGPDVEYIPEVLNNVSVIAQVLILSKFPVSWAMEDMGLGLYSCHTAITPPHTCTIFGLVH